MRHRRFVAFALGSAVMLACSSSPSQSRPPVRNSSSDLITTAEIEATPVSNAHDLVNRLRPRWLQQGGRVASISGAARGDVAGQVILVYLDNTKLGGIETLRSLSTSGFKTLQWLDAVRATTLLRDTGNQPLAGAIVIKTSQQ